MPFDAARVAQDAYDAILARHTGLRPGDEVCLQLDADAAVADLNGRFRGKPAPTNVLAFPAAPLPGAAFTEPDARPLGDIVLACETVLREADEQNKIPGHHMAHLTVHGLLHLLGHDHQSQDEADIMEALEVRILADLGIPDPYGETRSGEGLDLHGEYDD